MNRPIKEQYEGFMNEFSSELQKHFPEVCFGVYGSIVNGNACYGKADIDGFLIMPGKVLSNKLKVFGLSQILARALSNNPVTTQFNLLDLETCIDGRFMSYTKDYSKYIKDNARVICGPHHHLYMNGLDPKFGVLHNAAFNFSGPGGVRNSALYSLSVLQEDSDKFSLHVQKAIDNVAKFPSKLIWLRTGKVTPNRLEAQRVVKKNLDCLNYKLLDNINDILDNVSYLDYVLADPEKSLDLVYNGLEIMEQMICAYVYRHPFIGKREVGVINH